MISLAQTPFPNTASGFKIRYIRFESMFLRAYLMTPYLLQTPYNKLKKDFMSSRNGPDVTGCGPVDRNTSTPVLL
jgi:hypothetical protein